MISQPSLGMVDAMAALIVLLYFLCSVALGCSLVWMTGLKNPISAMPVCVECAILLFPFMKMAGSRFSLSQPPTKTNWRHCVVALIVIQAAVIINITFAKYRLSLNAAFVLILLSAGLHWLYMFFVDYKEQK